MKILVFGHREDETGFYRTANCYGFEIDFLPQTLTLDNVAATKGYDAVSIIASTRVDDEMAALLHENGVGYILSRTAGKDHLDLGATKKAGLRCAYVPEYSPASIAEHAVMLTLEVLRHRTRQFRRIENYDFRIVGVRGQELRSKTVGVVGTGKIGAQAILMLGGIRLPHSGLWPCARAQNDAVCTIYRA